MNLSKLLNITALFCLMMSSAVSSELTVSLSNNNYYVYHLSSSNSTQDFPIDIQNVNQVMIDVVSSTQAPQVQLIAPSGIEYTPDELNAYLIDFNSGIPLGALFFEPGNHVQMIIKSPVAGQWLLRLTLPQGTAELLGNASVVRQGGVAMNVFTSRSLYNQGQQIVIGSALFNDGIAVEGATVTADVIQKSNIANVYTVNLYDSGTTPDSAANDGLYTGTINKLQVGDYSIYAKAIVGSSQLESVTDLRIVEPLASIKKLINDEGVDTNGDGLFEFIGLNVELEVFKAGLYELQGHIQGGSKLISSVKNTQLSAGIQTVSILFKAKDIRKYLAVDGPYNIKDLTLVTRFSGTAGSNLIADRHENLGLTKAYLLKDLQRPALQILSGIETTAVDPDNDQLIDILTTKFKVDLLISGSFTWSGSLLTGSGQILGVASGQSYLTVGQNTLSFNFNGTNIGESGVDGPYYLRNVAIYGSGNAAISDEVGATKAYLYTEFEGSEASFDNLRNKINSLVITGRGGKPRGDGIRVSLLAKLDNAEKASIAGGGQINTAKNILNALSLEIEAQSGLHISPSDVSELLTLVQKISNNL
jgi:hypothetical protein